MKNKNDLNKLKKAYFKVPNKIFTMGLPIAVIGFYTYLAKQPEDFNPAVRTAAKELKISKSTVVKYFQELKNRNIIRVIQPGGENVITKYEFNGTKFWT